ncbi:hypothetical protein HMPREF0388_1457 [Mobiluncus curtisii ATCC 51333]|uniref:Uncharacterized protein n=1 Tax=Mobiluncus curtisii ATCC 51333 TaxID=887326 RepID=E6M074_9ACTO|nr:hypothetical protein HMPREF0388_1457 [Mobiluncus curtisii ATCC 51333]
MSRHRDISSVSKNIRFSTPIITAPSHNFRLCWRYISVGR